MEVELPHRWGDGHTDLRPDVIHLEYGAVPRGYAWVFPKGDHLNIGAGIFRPRSEEGRGHRGAGSELRRAIKDYAYSLGLAADPDRLPHHAHPIPPWAGRERLNARDGRVLLVGDAAGLVGPLFGDGILSAIKSGLIAAQAIGDDDAAQYTRRLHAAIGREFDAALRLSRIFYQFSAIAYRHGIARPGATAIAARLLSGEALFTDVAGRTLRRLRRAIAGRGRGSADDTTEDALPGEP
jgi:flavin-dependent dehydrogenase